MRRSIIAKAETESPHPEAGDVCVGCVHKPDPEAGCHYYLLKRPDGSGALEFTRPDGTRDIAHWLLVCNDCFARFGGNVEAALERGEVKVACDMRWPEGVHVRFERN
jgi:hypothetical protein